MTSTRLYFSKELIEVGDINFLDRQKNGAGKSTVIDALQIVLLGETNSTILIRQPTKTRSAVKKAICAPTWMITARVLRRGKDFFYLYCLRISGDEMEGSSFVTGVTFDCRSDGRLPVIHSLFTRGDTAGKLL